MRLENILNQRYETILVRYYNRIAQAKAARYDDIPENVAMFLSCMDYKQIVLPFILEELQEGKSRRGIAKRYGLKEGWVRDQGRKFGYLPKNKWCKPTQ